MTRTAQTKLSVVSRLLVVILVFVLCGTLITFFTSGGGGPPRSLSVGPATLLFRAVAQVRYHGTPEAYYHGRGCAKVTSVRFLCTTYVRNPQQPSRKIDVYGSVTVTSDAVKTVTHVARGREIQNWFADTNGGCKTNMCRGTVWKKPTTAP